VKKLMNLNKQLSTLHTQYKNNVYWRKLIYKSSTSMAKKKAFRAHLH
jgi:hypothetical protein